MSHWFSQGFKLPHSKLILIITKKRSTPVWMERVWHVVREMLRYRIIICVLGGRGSALPAAAWQLMKSRCNFTWKSQARSHAWSEKSSNGAALKKFVKQRKSWIVLQICKKPRISSFTRYLYVYGSSSFRGEHRGSNKYEKTLGLYPDRSQTIPNNLQSYFDVVNR